MLSKLYKMDVRTRLQNITNNLKQGYDSENNQSAHAVFISPNESTDKLIDIEVDHIHIILDFFHAYFNYSFCYAANHNITRICCKNTALTNIKYYLNSIIEQGTNTQKIKASYLIAYALFFYEKNVIESKESVLKVIINDKSFIRTRAYVLLGDIYCEEKNMEQAKKYYKLAIHNENVVPSLIGITAFCLAEINATEKNFVEAEEYYKLAIDNKIDYARHSLAYFYMLYDSHKYKDDIIKLLKIASEHKYIQSMCLLGRFYKYWLDDKEQGEKYLKMAIDKGHDHAKEFIEIHDGPVQYFTETDYKKQKEEIISEIHVVDAEIVIAEQELELLKRKKELESLRETKKRRIEDLKNQ